MGPLRTLGGPLAAPDATAATAPVAQAPTPRPKNQVDVMFGASYWNDLGDLDTSGGIVPNAVGDFDSWGWAFDFGYDRVVWSNRDVDMSVGIESGWSTFASDGRGFSGGASDISSSMWYLTPAMRWHFPLSRQATLIAGVGAGYYGFSIDEVSTYYYGWYYGYDARTLNQDDAFGGFASVAFDFDLAPGAAIRLDNKVHIVEFDGVDTLLPNESSVDGPIWTIEIGFAYKF
jgi:hypothetical protein